MTATGIRIEGLRKASPVSSSTYLGKNGAQNVADTLPTTKPSSPSTCCRIMPAMVRLRVPMSLRTAISRILPSVMV